jgi:hypothetical protein
MIINNQDPYHAALRYSVRAFTPKRHAHADGYRSNYSGEKGLAIDVANAGVANTEPIVFLSEIAAYPVNTVVLAPIP